MIANPDTSTGENTNHPPAPTRSMANPIDGQVYVWIPAGNFIIGYSPGDNECHNDAATGYADEEVPPHQVAITRGFWIGQTPATQEAYQRVMGTNPSHIKGAQLPVEAVGWNSAQNYCRAVGMRLPTEAEWEYAARARTTASRYGDIDQIAWYQANSGNTTHEVMRKQPNAWGLYDMLGDVWQWTADWSGSRYSGDSVVDPQGPETGEFKILRGGAWRNAAKGVRVSLRLRGVTSDIIGGYFGFRCAGNSPDSPHGTKAITSTRGADPPNHVYKADAEGVTHALVLFQVEPEYTEQARKAKVNGVVLVQFVIDERGKPQNIQVTQGIGMGLDQKAVQAIRKWKFKPAEKDGKPVATIAHAQVNFRLL
jgi:TonB family protein